MGIKEITGFIKEDQKEILENIKVSEISKYSQELMRKLKKEKILAYRLCGFEYILTEENLVKIGDYECVIVLGQDDFTFVTEKGSVSVCNLCVSYSYLEPEFEDQGEFEWNSSVLPNEIVTTDLVVINRKKITKNKSIISISYNGFSFEIEDFKKSRISVHAFIQKASEIYRKKI